MPWQTRLYNHLRTWAIKPYINLYKPNGACATNCGRKTNMSGLPLLLWMSYTLDSDTNSSACLNGYSPTDERNDITACMQAHDSTKRNKYHTRKDTLEACSKKVKTLKTSHPLKPTCYYLYLLNCTILYDFAAHISTFTWKTAHYAYEWDFIQCRISKKFLMFYGQLHELTQKLPSPIWLIMCSEGR